MNKLNILLIVFTFACFRLSAQTTLGEGFESGSFQPFISFQSVGTFSSNPGIVNNTDFGSNKAFSFGQSTCGSSCFNNYMTTLIITFPTPVFVSDISWKEIEINGNWGSQGQLYLDDIMYSGITLGAQPVNSGVADAMPQNKFLFINQTVTTIKLRVNDISSASQILLDDLFINYTAPSNITGYEYWFNSDYAGKTTVSVVSTQQLSINQNIPTAGLVGGLNVFNFRSYDNLGQYSSVLSSFFYKASASQTNPTPQIVAYEYWIDNDYTNAVVVNTLNQQQFNINELISMNSLNNGLHQFNIRIKDNMNVWSSVLSSFFYKTPVQIVAQNQMTEYRYWFDNDFTNAVDIFLPSSQQINVFDNLDLTQLPKGMHAIHFQFKDTTGLWSVVIADSIQKMSLPIADFTYNKTTTCDSTIVSFVDKSIDGDTYYWDFGDGTTSTVANPQHTYYVPGTYSINQTVTDTLTLADSTIVQTINVTGKTFASINPVACDNYISPSNISYNVSGIYNDTIPNNWGCDSIITINLTVNNSSYFTDTHSACGTFTWIDSNTYISSNNTATFTLQNINGCDSIITLNLTINPFPDNSVTQNDILLTANQTGATYQWLDCNNSFAVISNETNQIFTPTQNGSYAVEVSLNGCADTSNCFTVSTVGIVENSFNHDIIVYPNPTNEKVRIDLGYNYDEITITVQSLNGQKIKQSHHKNQQVLELNLDVPNGIYFVSIESENKKTILKIIKH